MVQMLEPLAMLHTCMIHTLGEEPLALPLLNAKISSLNILGAKTVTILETIQACKAQTTDLML